MSVADAVNVLNDEAVLRLAQSLSLAVDGFETMFDLRNAVVVVLDQLPPEQRANVMFFSSAAAFNAFQRLGALESRVQAVAPELPPIHADSLGLVPPSFQAVPALSTEARVAILKRYPRLEVTPQLARISDPASRNLFSKELLLVLDGDYEKLQRSFVSIYRVLAATHSSCLTGMSAEHVLQQLEDLAALIDDAASKIFLSQLAALDRKLSTSLVQDRLGTAGFADLLDSVDLNALHAGRQAAQKLAQLAKPPKVPRRNAPQQEAPGAPTREPPRGRGRGRGRGNRHQRSQDAPPPPSPGAAAAASGAAAAAGGAQPSN
jgi:hypothetical protein